MKHILERTSFAELRGLFERAQKAKEYARHNPYCQCDGPLSPQKRE